MAALTCLVLAGCAGGEAIEAIYRLTPIETAPGAGTTRAQILVPKPNALASLDTERIAVKPTPISLAYYDKVAWEDDAPTVFQVLLLESLQNTGRVGAVGLPGQSLLIDYQLVAEIRHFQAETFGSDQARVAVSVKILNDRNGRVVSERLFEARAPMGGDGVTNAVEGIDRATQAVVADIVAWVLATI